MYKVLVKNVIENKYQGTVKYDIVFPQCIENDEDFCQAFMDSKIINNRNGIKI